MIANELITVKIENLELRAEMKRMEGAHRMELAVIRQGAAEGLRDLQEIIVAMTPPPAVHDSCSTLLTSPDPTVDANRLRYRPARDAALAALSNDELLELLRRSRSDSATGWKNVVRNGKAYGARVRFNDRLVTLGSYPTADEAGMQAAAAWVMLHRPTLVSKT